MFKRDNRRRNNDNQGRFVKKDQRKMLSLLSKGYTQKQIAEELKMSQSNVSQKLNNIKKELQESMIQIMPYIL